MFDQYGTVVDIQGGLVEYATPFLQAKGWTGSPNAFVTWWRRTHFENAMMTRCSGATTRPIARSARLQWRT